MKYINNFTKKDGGIYKITNLINNKSYVGRTKNFYRRYHQYIYSFKNKKTKSINNYLLASAEKYGLDNFEFETIVKCSILESLELENNYMKIYNTTDRNFGYNLRQDSSGGMITSSETSEKISNRLKKEWKDGKRDSHSKKLKKSWETRNRKDQSNILIKNLTKYYYIMSNNNIKLTYKDLVKLGFRNIIESFHRNKSDEIVYKFINFKRIKIDNPSTTE